MEQKIGQLGASTNLFDPIVAKEMFITRLNKQYDVHIFIGTGWQVCQQMIPGFLPRCSYIFARYTMVPYFLGLNNMEKNIYEKLKIALRSV